VLVGAAPERGGASRDLPVEKEVELRVFLERSMTQGTIYRSAGEFSLSAGSFWQNSQSARVGYPRGPPCTLAGCTLLGYGGEVWAVLSN
jgi:hypothetical protein